MQPSVPLPDDADLEPEVRELLSKLPPLNVFRMWANAPASFQPLVEFAFSLLMKSEFDPRKREIAILRVAHVTRASYEWFQHVIVAKRVGVTDQEIEKIGVDGPVTGLEVLHGPGALFEQFVAERVVAGSRVKATKVQALNTAVSR